MRQKTQNHFLKFSIHLSVRKSREKLETNIWKFNVLACIAGTRTLVHCFFQFRLVYNTWFKLSRVKLQRNDLKGNKIYFELAWVNYSNWLYEGIPGEIDLSKCDVPVLIARVRTIGMTRRFFTPGFRMIGTNFYRPHKVSLLHMPLSCH